MKDEALSPMGFLMEALPIAEPTIAIRTAIEIASRRLIDITASQQQTHRTVLDWLRMEYAKGYVPQELFAQIQQAIGRH